VMAVSNCSSTDLTRQLDRMEREIKQLRNDINSNHFKLNANLNGLADFLGKGKVSWIEMAAMIASIVSAVAGIANIVQIWAQGAYLSKILSASEQAAKNSDYTAKEVQGWAKGAYFSKILAVSEQAAENSAYTAKEVQGWAKGAYFSKILQSTQSLENFLQRFGSSTAENFRVLQQQILKIPSQDIKKELSRIERELELIPSKIADIPAIKDVSAIPNRIKEIVRDATRETSGEISKIPEQITGTVTRIIYEPLRQKIQEIPRQLEGVTREVTLLRNTSGNSNPKLDQILSDLVPLGLIPANIAGLDSKINKLNNDLNQKINGLPRAVATANCNSGCSLTGAASRGRLEAGQNLLNSKIDAFNAAMNTAQLGLLRKIDGTTTKTLSQLGNPLKGGISGKLSRIGDVLSQSPVISWINLLVTLHNAGQLSASIVTTLGDYLSFGLNSFVFKDSESMQIDVNRVIGDSVQGWIIKIIGLNNYTKFKNELALYNNIYRSSANVVNTIRSIGDSTNAIASVAAENSGKIGNALLKDRVIAEDSFPWMSENVTPSSAVIDRLNNLDDAANALGMVLAETTNLIDSKKELDEQTKKFEEDLEKLDPRTRPANKPIQADQILSKANSEATLIDDETVTGLGQVQ
jgi:hypothetical protein